MIKTKQNKTIIENVLLNNIIFNYNNLSSINVHMLNQRPILTLES